MAGRYLAPFIAKAASKTNQPSPALTDLDPAPDAAADHREAVELALAAAESDAACLDYRNALRWLAVAEQLDLTLGAKHSLKREQWKRALKKSAGNDAAACVVMKRDSALATPSRDHHKALYRAMWMSVHPTPT